MTRTLPIALLLLLLGLAHARAQTPSLEVTPLPIVFGCTLSGEDSARAITVRNTGTGPITIVEYRSTTHFVGPTTVNRELAAGDAVTEVVHFMPLAAVQTNTIVTGTMTVATSAGDLVVDLQGEIGVEPAIVPSAREILFDLVDVGRDSTICIQVSNLSCRPLSVETVAIDPSVFRVSQTFPSLPYELRFGDQVEICITFSPADVGDVDGELHLAGELGKRTVVRLNGRGVRAELLAERTSIDFGDLDLGATKRDTAFVANNGTSSATIDSITITGANPADFVLIEPATPTDMVPTSRRRVVVEFRPTTSGEKTALLTLHNSSAVEPTIALRGFAHAFEFVVTPDTIDMGDVLVGAERSVEDTITISNRSTRVVIVRTTTLQGGTPASFDLQGFITAPIDAGTNYTVGVTFRPTVPGPQFTDVVGVLDNGSEFRVRLIGFGIDTAGPVRPRPRRIVGDTLAAHVGDRSRLRFEVTPPLAVSDSVTRLFMRLRLDPLALYPHAVDAGSAVTTSRSYRADGTVDVTLASPSPMTLAGFDVEIEGLFTGRPVNRVSIDSIDAGDRLIGFTSTPATVYLEGCDIRPGDTLARAVRIVSIVPNPASSEAVLEYVATHRATLRIVALDGRVIAERALESSSGASSRVALALDDVADGPYLIELASGDRAERTMIQINR